MHDELKKTLDGVFAGYAPADALEEIKAEMALVLEEKFAEARRRGVIEEAAGKKILSELGGIVKNADLQAGGDKQKRLTHIARALGLSPLGRRKASLRLLSWLLALCGLGAAIGYWLIGREAAGALAALLPFAASAAGGLVFVLLTRYRAERAATSAAGAAKAALGAALLCAALLGALASALK